MAKETLKSIPLSENQIFEIKTDSMAYDNSAIGRYRDFVVFVDRAAPGDNVLAQATTLRPNYARATILEIQKFDSSYRIEPKCKVFKVCGGCQWQHLPYEKQLEQKNILIADFFKSLNIKGDKIKLILPSYDIWNYRNKVQYPVRTVQDTGRLKAGYFEWHSNELVNIKHCPIQNNLFDEIIETVRNLAEKYKIVAYDSKTKKGWLRHICVRLGINTGQTLLTLVGVNSALSNSQTFVSELMEKFPQLVGVCININNQTTNVIYGSKTEVLKGKGYIYEIVSGIKYKISATSFFQVNTSQSEKLLSVIHNFLSPEGHETVLDAYSGVGLISLFLAKHVKKVIGIEEIKQSIEDAKTSLHENNIDNVISINGKVENKIQQIIETYKPEVIILDPPRGGCAKSVLNNICGSSVKKIIYVSCNPSTLVRDLNILCSGETSNKSFKIKTVQPIDMFPHSYHIESVVLLER
jgi:23S rRNA (uracil1939-C5)-methyltransferase